jgi:hypothetical protein
MDAMKPFYPEILRHSPLRPPDWRWRRAESLVAQGRYFSQGRDDAQTGRAARYLRALARRSRPAGEAIRHYPDVHAARRLHEGGGPIPLMVQARLLARQSIAEVARFTGTPAEVVSTYEGLFFNVVGCLDAQDWVLVHAIGRGASAGTADPDTGVVLKSFAYFGGLIVLEAVLPYLVGGKDLFDPPLDLSTREGRTEQAIRLAVAAQMLPRGAATDKKLHKIMAILLERERQRPVRPAPAALLAQNVDFMLDELPVGACPGHVDAKESTLHATVPEASGQVA